MKTLLARLSRNVFSFACLILLGAVSTAQAANSSSIPSSLLGDWSLDIPVEDAGWLSVSGTTDAPVVCMLMHVGSTKPLKNVSVENGTLNFTIKQNREKKGGPILSTETIKVGMKNGKLKGTHNLITANGQRTATPFSGIRLSPMPSKPKLSKVRYGKPITLFNGKDLTGWRLSHPHKVKGWSAKNGELVNDTPKTDFSATGAYANLRTDAEFEDFKLHIEFNIGAQRNSGVYLRGIYEIQVVDRDSRMQGLQGPGAVFSRILPTENAGKPGGEWQSYDITLQDRHITVVLNGKKVIDNQPVIGPTGGALYSNVDAPGPIYLQGDHTSVKYRNIVLTPALD